MCTPLHSGVLRRGVPGSVEQQVPGRNKVARCRLLYQVQFSPAQKLHSTFYSTLIRSAIICEDSDQLIGLIEHEEGVDVRNWTVPAENPVDLKIFNLELDVFDFDLDSVDPENAESTTQKEKRKQGGDLSDGWYTKSAETAETTETTAELQTTTTGASYWSNWFGASEESAKTTTKKPPTTTTTKTTSGWFIKSGASAGTTKTTTARIPEAEATTTEESSWSDWYLGK